MSRSTVLTDQQYLRFRDLVYERLGLHFPEKKRRDLERAIMGAFSQSQTSSFDEYYDLLSSASKDNKEMQRLVALATVGETYFYRDHKQFDLLRTTILPQLINARSTTSRELRIWSAGCATGEEPYTIAMVIKELLPLTEFWNIHILATDVNHKALKKAREGSYGNWSFRSNDSHLLVDKYFDKHAREYRVREEIKDLVTIDYLNLADGLYPAPFTGTDNLDLIVFRNVAIYFSNETTTRIAEKFADCLNEGGWLLTGASDPSLAKNSKLCLRDFDGCFIYQKTTQARKAAKPKSLAPITDEVIPQLLKPVPADPPKPVIVLDEQLVADMDVPELVDTLSVHQTPSALEQAAVLIEEDRVEEALELLRQHSDSGTDSARACYMIAKVEADRGNLADANRWCSLAVENNKLMIEAHFLMATIAQEVGDNEKAIECLKKTIYINRTFAEAYVCLGSIYRRLGKEAQARKALANAARILEDRRVESLSTAPVARPGTPGKVHDRR